MAIRQVWCDITQSNMQDDKDQYRLSQIALNREGLNPLHPVSERLTRDFFDKREAGTEYILPVMVKYDGRHKGISGQEVVKNLCDQQLVTSPEDTPMTLIPTYQFKITPKLKANCTEKHVQLTPAEWKQFQRKLVKAPHADQLWRHAYDTVKGGDWSDMNAQDFRKSVIRTTNLTQRLIDQVYLHGKTVDKAVEQVVDPKHLMKRREQALKHRQKQLSLDL